MGARKQRLKQVKELCSGIKLQIFGIETFKLKVTRDKKAKKKGRIYMQICYRAPCTVTSRMEEFHGRKFYLSDYMIDDEIIKTAYLAWKLAVEHEIMEGFTIGNKPLFNPHVNYKELLMVSHKEISRIDSRL